jgi:hypothetical protein
VFTGQYGVCSRVRCVQEGTVCTSSTVSEIKISNSVKLKFLFTSNRLSVSQKGFRTMETGNPSYHSVRVCKPDLRS